MTGQKLVPLDERAAQWLTTRRKKHDGDLTWADIAEEVVQHNCHYLGRHVPWENDDTVYFGWINSNFHGSDDIGKCHNIWDLKSIIGKTEPQEVVADFYLYDAIASGVLSAHLHDGIRPMSYNWELLNAMFEQGVARKGEPNQLQSIMDEGLQSFTELVIHNTPVFMAYAKYAICTELNYSKGAQAFLGIEARFSFHERNKNLIDHVGVVQWAEWSAELFRNPDYGEWGSAFGGEPWAQCSDVVAMFGRGKCEGMPFTEREFLDRVFSLRHNTDTFLNKYSWAGYLGSLGTILDAHANSKWGTLTNFASDKAKRLFGRYLAASGDTKIANSTDHYNTVNGMTKLAYDTELKGIQSEPEAKAELPNVKQMTAYYAGVCKTSGKVINTGDDIIWHGKGNGASLLKEYNA